MFGSLPFDHFVAPRWGERSQVYNVVLRIIHYEIPCGSYTRNGSRGGPTSYQTPNRHETRNCSRVRCWQKLSTSAAHVVLTMRRLYKKGSFDSQVYE
jgi:hypothetical protein